MTRSLSFDPEVPDPGFFSDEWEQIIREFEQAWLAGQFPDIAKALPNDVPARAAILPQLVLADLEFRLKRREPVRVETYLQRFPELSSNSPAVREFVAAEFHLRRRFEPLLSPAEYQRRFPQFADLIGNLTDDSSDAYGTQMFRLETVAGTKTDNVLLQSGDSITMFRSQDDPITDAGDIADWSDLEIREEIGQGGMGRVYLAWQRSLERIVAVKVLRSFADLPADAHVRFRREAIAAAQLHHPNIVQVFSIGEIAGVPFYVMEHVAGGDLARRLNGQRWPARGGAQLIETLARALHVAHQQRLLHRDLKPSNILLTSEGIPKVGDFGLAKRLDQSPDRTTRETLMGTPSYMSPEQAVGESETLTPATDVYSLGAILYELLTGQPPFVGGGSLQVLDRVRTAEPMTPRRLVTQVPADLETICLQCLRKEPSRRYPTALALAEDLRRFLNGEPIQARRHRAWSRVKSWCRRQPALAATSLTLLLAVISVGMMLPGIQASHRHAADAKRRLDNVRKAFRDSHVALYSALNDQASKLQLRRACRYYEVFLNEHEHDSDLLAERAIAQLGWGIALEFLQEHDFVEHWNVAGKLFDQIIPSSDGSDPISVYWFTILQCKLANWHREHERLDEAWTALQTARTVLEPLVAKHPDDLWLRYSLAWCYARHGQIGQKGFRAEEALSLSEQACRIWKELDTPEAPSLFDERLGSNLYRNRHGWTLKYMVLTLQSLERHEESLQRGRELLLLAQSEQRRSPETVRDPETHIAHWRELELDAHYVLARAHYMIGKQLLNDARPGLAVPHFHKSIEHWSEVVESGVASPSKHWYLASSHFHLAIAHRRQGHRHEALSEYQRAVSQWKPMLDDTNLMGFNRELTESHFNESWLEIEKIQDQLVDAHGSSVQGPLNR